MDKFIDKDLGEVRVVRNVRAKNVIARHKGGYIQLTVLAVLSESRILKAFEQIKPRLSKLKAKPVLMFDTNTQFSTYSFRVKIELNNIQNYYISLKEGSLNIVCPAKINFELEATQTIIRNAIENAMRHEAKRIFPDMLDKLAILHQFEYNGLKINKSRTRWGSCSSRKSINLSYYCLLLPEHLIKFVMLHELCHTLEMNHGDNFWKILDRVTDGQAQQLTKELKTSAVNW